MRIAFASHTGISGVFRVGSHHLAREFAKLGHHVDHYSGPVSAAHLTQVSRSAVRSRLAHALQSPRVDEAGVRHVELLTVLPTSAVAPSRRVRLLRHPILGATKAYGGRPIPRPDVLFIDQPLLSGLIDVLQPRLTVYRPTDAHFDPTSRSAEIELLGRANAIVATSESVLEQVLDGSARDHLPKLVLENGVEFDRFSLNTPIESRESSVLYLGALDERFAWNDLRSFATAFPDTSFKVAGPRFASGSSSDLPANVKLVGPVPYALAPEFLNSGAVGLLPLSANRGNLGRSPMKYYEYLASGLRVVATSSPALLQRNAPGVYLYDDPNEGVSKLRQALADPSVNAKGRAYAEEFSWAHRALQLRDFVESIPGL